ncbi:MAG: hypothetical protein CMM87_03205 [Rickettsiales bacterium]|mgnify:CR=1 FL=1|nr:hypothetical protein [Rickettsiales bacterium]|tara:strand:- start:8646 stop:9746 length:1101 start_codon:yes stop_codon:yes gene_type:complete
MRITFVISSLNSGGAERVISQLSNYLVEKNHQVTIITLAELSSKPFYQLSNLVKLRNINKKTPKNNLFIKRLFCILSRVHFLRREIHNSQPNIVVSFIDIMNITTLLSMFSSKIPVIVSERIDPNHHKIPRLYNWLRKKLYPRSYRIIVQTKCAMNFFCPEIKKKCQIIPNPNWLKPNSNKIINLVPRKIISVGRLNVQKDHETLIKAMPKVVRKFPELTLEIYGEGPLRPKLQALINNLGLAERVYLVGNRNYIQNYLNNADLFVFPSKYEGFPNALLEAMSLGLPCIASNCSGNNDIIEQNLDGRLFQIANSPLLSKLIINLLSSYEDRKRLSKNAQLKAQKYEPEKILNQWESLFFNACEESS